MAELEDYAFGEEIAAALWKALHETDTSPRELTRLADVSSFTVARLLEGKGTTPTLKTLATIFDALGYDIHLSFTKIRK